MKTLVLSLADKRNNADLKRESAAIRLLNANAVYVDALFKLDVSDKDGFILALDGAFDAVLIVGAGKANFDCKAALCDIGVDIDEDGFFVGKRFVAFFTDDQAFAEKLTAKLSGFFGFSVGRATFRLFGETEEKIRALTDQISDEAGTVFFNVESYALDTKVDLFYSEKTSKFDVDAAIKRFLTTFAKNVYATEDVTLEKRLKDLLKLHRLTVSTAESMTGGNIAARIVSVDGASDVFYEGMVTYATAAKERRLNVSHKTVVDHTVVSSEVAYEMAASLLERVDLAISVTGYAGGSVHPDDSDGTCFIGVGVKNEINVYRFRFTGTRKENIESATNAALFLAINVIKNTDF